MIRWNEKPVARQLAAQMWVEGRLRTYIAARVGVAPWTISWWRRVGKWPERYATCPTCHFRIRAGRGCRRCAPKPER